MNTQRWIALGLLIAVFACLLTSNLWLPSLLGDEDEAPDSTATAMAADPDASGDDNTAEDDSDASAGSTEDPDMDPAVADILDDLAVEAPEIGLDPHITHAGNFTTIDEFHQGFGTATIWQISESQRVLRLDPFAVTNGPDLMVILSQNEIPRTSSEVYLPDYVSLGVLKTSDGSQNYDLPQDLDISQFKSVVIYSTSLNLVYSSAPLSEVRGR